MIQLCHSTVSKILVEAWPPVKLHNSKTEVGVLLPKIRIITSTEKSASPSIVSLTLQISLEQFSHLVILSTQN